MLDLLFNAVIVNFKSVFFEPGHKPVVAIGNCYVDADQICSKDDLVCLGARGIGRSASLLLGICAAQCRLICLSRESAA